MNKGQINNLRAREYFGIKDNRSLVLHHVDPTLKYTDPERYYEWRPEDLVVMTREEHSRIHNTGKTLSQGTKKKLSQALKGMKFSEEHKRKIGAAHAKPVRCIETGQVFKSSCEASISLGVVKRTVSLNIRRGYKTRGYTFEYISKEI